MRSPLLSLRTEEESSTQDQEGAAGEAGEKSGKDGILEAKQWSDCVVLPRGHSRWELMIDDWIWQHRDPE